MQNGKKLLLGGALALSLLLSGCQPAPQQTEPTAITVWTYYNGDQLAAFNELVDEFNETEGGRLGIRVESCSQGTVNDLETNVLAAAAGEVGADEVPNIFAAYADTAYAVDQMGLAADLRAYLTEEELDLYVDSYLDEGRFSGGVKIFPTAKSTEVLLVNRTDWDRFAQATGASFSDLETVEGLVAAAGAYYRWTDSLTPEPEDGKALFGRDAMANYFLVGAMQLGTELFQAEDGTMELDFDRETVRTLWDNYYVPYVKGWFASSGRFRSDDIKTGNIIAYVGASSSATFFPTQVVVSDTESYPIEMTALPCPKFSGGADYAVQQGAGMVVTAGSEEEVRASVEFLKWFTSPERNIAFSVGSGYLPVTKAANDMAAIRASGLEMTPVVEEILAVAVDTVNENRLYTPRAFSGGTDARSVLEYSMSDLAQADRARVEERLAQGQTLDEAAADLLTDAHFEQWYQETLEKLRAFEG